MRCPPALLLGLALTACRSAPAPRPDFLATAVDRTADPRQSFYDWATGGYRQGLTLSADRGWYGFISQSTEALEEILYQLLDDMGPDEKVLVDFWKSGLAAEKRPGTGVEPLAPLLAGIDSVRDADGLLEEIGALKRGGVPSVFDVDVGPDFLDSTRHRLYLQQGRLGLPARDHYFPSDDAGRELLAAYQRYLEGLLKAIGDDPGQAAAVMALERAMAELSVPMETFDPTSYRVLPVAALGPLAWPRFFTALGAPGLDAVGTNFPGYLAGVSKLLAERPLAEWKAYLRIRVVGSYAAVLGADLRALEFELYGRRLGGLTEPRPWRARILALINRNVGDPLGRVFIRRHVPLALVERVREVVLNVKQTFRARLAANPWMTEPTRREALAKLDRMRFMLVEPSVGRDFSGLATSPDDFVGNLLAARRLRLEQDLARLGKPVDPGVWDYWVPQDWMAYYDWSTNTFVLTAGFLAFPGLDPEHPDAAYLYGIIGSTVAHEITHGFDNLGRKFDASGKLRDWWTPADAKVFETMTAKLVAQFDAYPIPGGVKISGARNLGENLADIVGGDVAFEAFARTPEFRAGKVNGLTSAERYFVGFSLFWSGLFTDEALRTRILVDPHTPPPWGVDGILEHVDSFHQTFGTRPGDKMYRAPADRVRVY